MQVIPSVADGSTVATVRLEALNPGEASLASVYDDAGRNDATIGFRDIRMLGHVAGIGDVVVPPNEWIAGPAAPSRIEGIAVEWPERPGTLDLRYAVRSSRSQGAIGRMVDLGSFAGTRGRALSITGIAFELTGPEAEDYELALDALFLGAPILRSTGRRIVAAGPTEREPLVGLRLNLEPFRATAARPLPRPSREKTTPAGHVRVFRGRQRASQPAV